MTDVDPTPPASPLTQDERETDPPVTVRTFAREDLRMPVIAFLQAEGVSTITPDGNTMSIDPGMYVALGFYKIQVPTSQVERATALLAQWDDAEPLPANIDTGEWQVEGGVQPEPVDEIAEKRVESWRWPLLIVAVLIVAYVVLQSMGGS